MRGSTLPLSYTKFDTFLYDDNNDRVLKQVAHDIDYEEGEKLEKTISSLDEVARQAADQFLDDQELETVRSLSPIDEYFEDDGFVPLRPPTVDSNGQFLDDLWSLDPEQRSFEAIVEEKRQFYEARGLNNFIRRKGRNSLLNEFAFQMAGHRILVSPYHSHAFHEVEAKNELLVAQPAVFASRTASLMRAELRQFEGLVNDPEIDEPAIQKFLEQHPAIFRSLGYAQVRWQVVLERDHGESLRPDFIVQPIGQEWWDVIELKRPVETTIVGRRDRKHLSQSIADLMAQLREYSAFFEDERLAKRVQDKYGIKCYRPKLIGLVGRTPRMTDERQARRAMTQYADVSIVTFDQLLAHAKSRLLI